MNEPETIQEILNHMKTVAVVGFSPKPGRPSSDIAKYLQDHGYRVIPVNPKIEEGLGMKAYPTVAAIPEKVDLANVFRRAEDIPSVVDDAIAAGVKYLWIQLGIVNREAALKAERAGIRVVMDRCIFIDHMRGRTARSQRA
jgi:predicted CoA-binding protein